MNATERFNQVRILKEDYPDTGARDDRGRKIQHAFSVVRVGDGVTLAKYRETEVVLESVKQKVKPGQEAFSKMEEVEISGMEAAKRTCKTNGWEIAKN